MKWWFAPMLAVAGIPSVLAEPAADDGPRVASGAQSDTAIALATAPSDAESIGASVEVYLGFMYERGDGVPKDNAEAAKWFRMAGDHGNVEAQKTLGAMYALGDGVRQDWTEAANWFRKAATQGSAAAQFQLGVMYENGDGVPQDIAESVKWYRKAADLGYTDAEDGQNPLRALDHAETMKRYQKAAEGGDSDAQKALGRMYLFGDGVRKDGAQAVKWYRQAAIDGDSDAQNSLGCIYLFGEGVPKDEIEGLAWFNVAAASGNDDLIQNRVSMEASLGPEATMAAQRRSGEILRQIRAGQSRPTRATPAATAR